MLLTQIKKGRKLGCTEPNSYIALQRRTCDPLSNTKHNQLMTTEKNLGGGGRKGFLSSLSYRNAYMDK